MARFRYVAVDRSGARLSGEEDVPSREILVENLLARGLTPIHAGAARSTDIVRHRGMRPVERAAFLRELADLLAAGVPVERALNLITEFGNKNRAASTISDIASRLRRGEALSTAFNNHPGSFPTEISALVAAGEAGGDLPATMARLASFEEARLKRREKLRSALAYPLLVAVMTLGTLLVLALYVLPQFKELFQDAGTDLPMATQIVLAIGTGIELGWPWLLAGCILAWVTLSRLYRRPQVRYAVSAALLRAGPLGRLLREAEAAIFAQTLSTLLTGGQSLATALDLSARCLSNEVMRAAIGRASRTVRQGTPLNVALDEEGILPARMIKLIALAEHSGRLPAALVDIARLLDREREVKLDRALALLPPILTLVLGLLVGTVVLAVIGGLVSINTLAL